MFVEPPRAVVHHRDGIYPKWWAIPQDGSGLSAQPAVAGAASPLSRSVGGGLEISGMVLSAGLALGIGAPSVVDLAGGLLLMIMGRAIRLPARSVHLFSWLAMTLALVAVATRWGSPSLEAIQGAQGVLGLATGTELTVTSTALAALGALLGLANHLARPPEGIEERVIQGAGAVVGGLALAATFLGRAGSEALTIPSGIAVGAAAWGLALLLTRGPARLQGPSAYGGLALAVLGLAGIASGL